MKFKYYIVDLMQGIVNGTDDDATAANFIPSDDFIVIDSNTGSWATDAGHHAIDQILTVYQ